MNHQNKMFVFHQGTPTVTATRTRANTPTKTYTRTGTQTYTRTSTSTSTVTRTFTKTLTKTRTFTNTFTNTATSTVTLTPTVTLTITSTVTPTVTLTPSLTPTQQVPQGETWLYYYYSGTTRIAMRQMSQYGDTVMFLLTDHLGSSSIVTDQAGAKIGEVRYKAWGETRYDNGNVPTKQRYTGQREETELGLMYYGARWYNSTTGRFVQADTIIPQPGNPLAWDRYSYTLNNPVRYNDPSGHTSACAGSNRDPECPPPSTNEETNNDENSSENNGDGNAPLASANPTPTDNGNGETCFFNPTLCGSGTNKSSDSTQGDIVENNDPNPDPVGLLIIGIPITVTVFAFEAVVFSAESTLILDTIIYPELAVSTVPMGLFIAGAGLLALDLEDAYLSYTYRVAFNPTNEHIKFEWLPPWGLY